METAGTIKLVQLLRRAMSEKFEADEASSLSDADRHESVSKTFKKAERFGVLNLQPAAWSAEDEALYQKTLKDATAQIVVELESGSTAAERLVEKFSKILSVASQADEIKATKYYKPENAISLEDADLGCMQQAQCEKALQHLKLVYKRVQKTETNATSDWREQQPPTARKL